MKADKSEMSSSRLIGLARAWGAYIRMLAAAIITRQGRITSRMNGSKNQA